MKEYLIASYAALLLTVITEVLAAVLMKIRGKHNILHIVLINCVTNPLLNVTLAFLFSLFANKPLFLCAVLILEAAVVIIESLYYKKMLSDRKRSPFLVSVVLNVSSFAAGIAVYCLVFGS